MCGGDIIKRKTLYLSVFALCMAISGLFYFGFSNSQVFIDSTESKDISLISTEYVNHVPSKEEVNAKSKKSRTIMVTAKCSCSLLDDYNLHAAKWINYCPQCHKYGTLKFTRGGGCPEGMLYCRSCDADFCSVHGREHVYGSATYLRSA
ncbi:hypothetical protein [Methanobacterium oryzae]|uniref:hypothetical protein n=1 Tax=Methanobacterium oryzae TaxID=69540 RepID=UPI003D233F9B